MRGKSIIATVICASLLTPPLLLAGRYSPQPASHGHYNHKQKENRFYINVTKMPLKNFIPYLAGLTGKRIVLLDKDAKEEVSFVGRTTLEELLDIILPPIGYGWEKEKGRYIISKYVTRVWRVDIPTVMKDISFTNPSGGSSVKYNLSYKEEVSRSVVALLQGLVKEGKISYDPVLGLLTFRGPRKEARALEPVVNKLSEVLKQSIRLRIEVVAIRLRNEYSTGINLSSLVRAGVPVNASISTAAGASPFSFGIKTANAEALFSALERYGKLKSVDSKEFNVISGFPIIYSSGGKVTYLREVSIAYLQVQQGGYTAIPSVNVSPGEETSGTEFILIPKKMEDNRLSLDVMFSQKQIDEIQEKTFEVQGQNTTLQLPQVSYSNFHTLSLLEEGEELILVSSVMDLNREDREGVPFLIRIPVLRFLFGKNAELSDKVQFIVRVRYEGSLAGSEYLSR